MEYDVGIISGGLGGLTARAKLAREGKSVLLLGNLGYFHDDPYTLSLPYYLTAQGSYYSGRANFIRGGSQADMVKNNHEGFETRSFTLLITAR